jgi:hypothetical protein
MVFEENMAGLQNGPTFYFRVLQAKAVSFFSCVIYLAIYE